MKLFLFSFAILFAVTAAQTCNCRLPAGQCTILSANGDGSCDSELVPCTSCVCDNDGPFVCQVVERNAYKYDNSSSTDSRCSIVTIDSAECPSATPLPTPAPATPSPSPTPSPALATPSPSPTPSPAPATPSPSPTPSPAPATPSPSPTPSPAPATPSPSPTPSPAPATPSPSPTPSPAPTPSPVPSTPSPTPSPSPSASPSPSPVPPTPSPTPSPSPTPIVVESACCWSWSNNDIFNTPCILQRPFPAARITYGIKNMSQTYSATYQGDSGVTSFTQTVSYNLGGQVVNPFSQVMGALAGNRIYEQTGTETFVPGGPPQTFTYTSDAADPRTAAITVSAASTGNALAIFNFYNSPSPSQNMFNTLALTQTLFLLQSTSSSTSTCFYARWSDI